MSISTMHGTAPPVVEALDDVAGRADVAPRPRPTGGAAATLLAAGSGCTFFGLLVLLNDASPWLHHKLTFSEAVGPLSGKTTVGMAGWLLCWAALHLRLRHRDVRMAPVVQATRLLVAIGFLLTFPPFYMLFAAE